MHSSKIILRWFMHKVTYKEFEQKVKDLTTLPNIRIRERTGIIEQIRRGECHSD